MIMNINRKTIKEIMSNRLILAAMSVALVLPMTSCASQRIKKTEMNQTHPITPTQSTLTVNPDIVLEGEWVIRSVGTTTIDREDNYPYVYFEPDDNSFYAYNGCNMLNGYYKVDKSNKISFQNVLATMKYCADTPFDSQINAAFGEDKALSMQFSEEKGESCLRMMDASGNEVLKLTRTSLSFLNGNWKVTEINGEKFDKGDMTIFFDLGERKVHGNTGCNSFNGDIYVDPQNCHALSLTNMAVTMRMCPNPDQQRKLLVALEEAAGANVAGSGIVHLVNSSGKPVIKLVADKVK